MSIFSQLESGQMLLRDPFASPLPEKAVEEPESPPLPVAPEPMPERVQPVAAKPAEPQRPADPVQPPVEIPPPDLTVSGIVWNTDRPQAIINDEIVGIGDTVEKVKIIDIRSSGIEGEFLGKPIMINAGLPGDSND